MNAPISRLFPIAEIISLRSQELSSSQGRVERFRDACKQAFSAIQMSALFPGEVKRPLETQEIQHFHDTILSADSLASVLGDIEYILPSLSYFAVPNEIIFEHIRPLYDGIMRVLDGILEIPHPWYGKLYSLKHGARDFFSEDSQSVKKFIALAHAVMVANTEGKLLDGENPMTVFDRYYSIHKAEIHKGFYYIYAIFLDMKNRIQNDMKPQADKIIEDTCRALSVRLTT